MLSNLEAVAKVRISNLKKTFLTIEEESWGQKEKMKKKLAQNHKITKWLKQEGTSGDHLVQLPCSNRVTYSSLSRTMSR